VIGEEDSFWDTYRKVTADVPTRGNLVPDAQLASILLGHGVATIYTHDRDFRKFSFLDVRDPLA
jgi:predicted nucleic acid-binding protein